MGTSGITITCNTTGRTGASATYTLNLNSPQPGDKVTLWYQNKSFISPISGDNVDIAEADTRFHPQPLRHDIRDGLNQRRERGCVRETVA